MNAFRFSLTWISITMILGCGPSQVATYPVSGIVVSDDGSPVRTGTVEFASRDNQLTATGTIREDGSFVLGTYTSNDGACAGEHRVIVMQLVINDGTVQHTKDHGKPVDPLYASYNTSPLTATIKEQADNTLKLTVSSRLSTR